MTSDPGCDYWKINYILRKLQTMVSIFALKSFVIKVCTLVFRHNVIAHVPDHSIKISWENKKLV